MTRTAVVARVVLIGLGVLLATSSAEHLVGSAALDAHYREAALPGVSRWTVGIAQGVAAVFLLLPATRRLAATVVAGVFSVIVVLALVRGRVSTGTAMAAGIAGLAVIGARGTESRRTGE